MAPPVNAGMTEGLGSGKISPEDVAVATQEGILRDRCEIRASKVQLLYWNYRFVPGVAERALRGS